MKIGIIDYGSGNFCSVFNAVSTITDDVLRITKPSDFAECSHIMLPGVGAFEYAMQRLNEFNFIEELTDQIIIMKKPFLGICVGMQVLAKTGYEFGEHAGLGWIDGEVRKFDFTVNKEMVLPHIGWNEVKNLAGKTLFKDIDLTGPSFYFVHSYHLVAKKENAGYSYSNYGYDFISAVESGNIFGVQFHPEKSQKNGIQLLRNFINVKY